FQIIGIADMQAPFSILDNCRIAELALFFTLEVQHIRPAYPMRSGGQPKLGAPFPPLLSWQIRIIYNEKASADAYSVCSRIWVHKVCFFERRPCSSTVGGPCGGDYALLTPA